jgi:hypothetical protein
VCNQRSGLLVAASGPSCFDEQRMEARPVQQTEITRRIEQLTERLVASKVQRDRSLYVEWDGSHSRHGRDDVIAVN